MKMNNEQEMVKVKTYWRMKHRQKQNDYYDDGVFVDTTYREEEKIKCPICDNITQNDRFKHLCDECLAKLSNKKYYKIKLTCTNCRTINSLNIPMGIKVSQFLRMLDIYFNNNTPRNKCSNCNCLLRVNNVRKIE